MENLIHQRKKKKKKMCALLCLLNLSYVQTHIGVSKLHPKFLLSLNPGC